MSVSQARIELDIEPITLTTFANMLATLNGRNPQARYRHKQLRLTREGRTRMEITASHAAYFFGLQFHLYRFSPAVPRMPFA